MRYFVTHLVPRNLIVKYKISTAAYNFCECLIDAGIFDTTLSILPTNITFYDENLKQCGFEVVKSRLRSSNKMLQLLACFSEQVKVFKRIKRGSDVWLYNLTILNIVIFILLKVFKPSVKIYTIVLDFTPEDRINKVLLPFINKSDGLIKLADSNLFTVSNAICLPGVVASKNAPPLLQPPLTKDFMIGGNIKEQIVMISMLLEAFSQLPECHLHISGQAQNPELIKKYADKYDNIHYYGFASYETYLSILKKCPFLLSTRDPKEPRNLCNFPSKIMEGLNNNKIIISTIHYNQLDGIKYIEVASDLDGFKKAIRGIAFMDDEAIITYANQSKLVQSLFNTNKWLEKIENIENHTR